MAAIFSDPILVEEDPLIRIGCLFYTIRFKNSKPSFPHMFCDLLDFE